PGTVVNTGGNNFRVDAPGHTYTEEGTYSVTVTVQHDLLAAVTSNARTIVVADQQLTNLASAGLPANGLEGTALASINGIATFTDPAGPEVVTDYVATINWGDGTTDSGTVVHTAGN